MPAPTRIYVVTNRGDDTQRLVRATTPAQAIRHVVRGTFGVAVAAQDTPVDLLQSGVTVEDAASEPEPAEATQD